MIAAHLLLQYLRLPSLTPTPLPKVVILGASTSSVSWVRVKAPRSDFYARDLSLFFQYVEQALNVSAL